MTSTFVRRAVVSPLRFGDGCSFVPIRWAAQIVPFAGEGCPPDWGMCGEGVGATVSAHTVTALQVPLFPVNAELRGRQRGSRRLAAAKPLTCSACRAGDYITKPFLIDEEVARVRTTLRVHDAWREVLDLRDQHRAARSQARVGAARRTTLEGAAAVRCGAIADQQGVEGRRCYDSQRSQPARSVNGVCGTFF